MRSRGRAILSIFLLVSVLLMPTQQLTAQASPVPTIVVLKVQGTANFTRQGWTSRQALIAGSLITPEDIIFAQNATLLVVCPDGNPHEFLPVDLIPDSAINCPKADSAYIVGQGSTQRLILHRGGTQSALVPYLISPRATVVRNPQIDLVWNAIDNVQSYSVTVRGGGSTWQSGPLNPAMIVKGHTAHVKMGVPAQENTAYTVDICVIFLDSSTRCTTDPAWSTGDNLAFYYAATPTLNDTEARMVAALGKSTPEALYARAVLLSQPFYQPSPSLSLGLYGEAIAMLEQIIAQYPKSALATSPDLYNLLGGLYQKVSLPLSATKAYELAAKLTTPATQAAATAAMGIAMTVPNSEMALDNYNAALDAYSQFLDKDAFAAQLAQVCTQIGDISQEIDRCATW